MRAESLKVEYCIVPNLIQRDHHGHSNPNLARSSGSERSVGQAGRCATHRSKSYLAGEVIRQYLEREIGQIGEIQQAIKEAGADDFASNDAVDAVVKKYAG